MIQDRVVLIRTENGRRAALPVSSVIRAEAKDGKTLIYVSGKSDPITFLLDLKTFCTLHLPSSEFILANQNTVINASWIETISHGQYVLKDHTIIKAE